MFCERYIHAVTSSDLRDDAYHTVTQSLIASAKSDLKGGSEVVLGSLLCRVKFGSATSKVFETGADDMASLLRDWSKAVVEKGKSRGWVKIKAEWDIVAAHKLYERVAHASLAHWIDSRCPPCGGAGVNQDRRLCTCCAGSGRAQIEAGRFESGLILDLVSELEGIYQSHSARAAALLRRAA
jgi:hypothetical protein